MTATSENEAGPLRTGRTEELLPVECGENDSIVGPLARALQLVLSRAQRDGLGLLEPPLLLTSEGAALLVGVSPEEWRRWQRSGRAPLPVRVSARPRFQREKLLAWLALDCPPRSKFEPVWASMRERAIRGGGR